MMFLIVILFFCYFVYLILNCETAKLSDNRLSTIYTMKLLGERKQCSARAKEIDVKIAESYLGKPTQNQQVKQKFVMA